MRFNEVTMMKPWLSLMLVVLLLPLTAAWGQQPDPQAEKSEDPRAAPAPQPADAPQPAEVNTRKVPLVGIASTEALSEHRKRLGLPEGVGLVVQYVTPGTPAAEAGLKRLDVLHRLNDQILANNPQFRVLIRTFAPGDTVTLGVFRDGKPLEIEVRLGETVVPVNQASCSGFQWTLIPAQSIQPADGSRRFFANYKDNRHVLSLRTDERGKQLLARDTQGKVLFYGFVNTSEQRDRVPEAILPKLERLETPPKPQSPRARAPMAAVPPAD